MCNVWMCSQNCRMLVSYKIRDHATIVWGKEVAIMDIDWWYMSNIFAREQYFCPWSWSHTHASRVGERAWYSTGSQAQFKGKLHKFAYSCINWHELASCLQFCFKMCMGTCLIVSSFSNSWITKVCCTAVSFGFFAVPEGLSAFSCCPRSDRSSSAC